MQLNSFSPAMMPVQRPAASVAQREGSVKTVLAKGLIVLSGLATSGCTMTPAQSDLVMTGLKSAAAAAHQERVRAEECAAAQQTIRQLTTSFPGLAGAVQRGASLAALDPNVQQAQINVAGGSRSPIGQAMTAGLAVAQNQCH